MLKFRPLGQSYQRSTICRAPLLLFMKSTEWNWWGHAAGAGSSEAAFTNFFDINGKLRRITRRRRRKKRKDGYLGGVAEAIVDDASLGFICYCYKETRAVRLWILIHSESYPHWIWYFLICSQLECKISTSTHKFYRVFIVIPQTIDFLHFRLQSMNHAYGGEEHTICKQHHLKITKLYFLSL